MRCERRVALLAVTLAIAGVAALPPALARLAQARERHATLVILAREQVRAPQSIVLLDAAFAGTPRAAAAMLAATVRDQAVREGSLIEQVSLRTSPAPGLVGEHAVVSGSEHSILRFVEAIEQSRPAIRLSSYRLEMTASGRALRLECDPVMAVAAP